MFVKSSQEELARERHKIIRCQNQITTVLTHKPDKIKCIQSVFAPLSNQAGSCVCTFLFKKNIHIYKIL